MAKVIITDDASLIRNMLGEIVKELGHTVMKACSGEELLDMYQTEKPDLVFLDIIMEENGFEVLQKLKGIDPDAKVVICSAIGGMQHVIEEARDKGAVACIRKPFAMEDIQKAIDMCMQE